MANLSRLRPAVPGALAFLAVLMAIIMIYNSVFYACITIATNRTVDASRRARLNGLSSIGASVGRGLGPILAGWLVSVAMSTNNPTADPLADPQYLGAVIIYVVLAVMGILSFFSTMRLADEDLPGEGLPKGP